MDMVASAAQFHLEVAALQMKNLKAMYILGQKWLGLDTDELDELQIEPNVERGWELIEEAALLGDRNCIWKMAQTQSPKNLSLAPIGTGPVAESGVI